MNESAEFALLQRFAKSAASLAKRGGMAKAIIGEGQPYQTRFGQQKVIYADYVASGRALTLVEKFVRDTVLPFYANTHTEGSFCGGFSTRLRAASRRVIAEACGAGPDYATIFCGSGATAGLNRLVHLFGLPAAVAAGERPLVIVGPYEHHSNILPWRESGAEVVEIQEARTGGPDLRHLRAVLEENSAKSLIVGSFSAASNVTGILTDVPAVTGILKAAGALVVWDYAGGGPYLPISMSPGGMPVDAIVTSPHKFVGGPGASGLLIVRREAVRATVPSQPGGGTVRFVSPWGQDYAPSLEAREEAGTPNVLGDIRAGLAFLVKDAIGTRTMEARHGQLIEQARKTWGRIPNLRILGNPLAGDRLPFFAFRIEAPDGTEAIHHQRVTRALSECYGIQARAGCACAGPYGHRLLGISRPLSDTVRQEILAGDHSHRPGWTRLNFSALMDDAKAARVIAAVADIATNPQRFEDITELAVA